ncbi:hypothetical protein [Sphingomonas sp.]|uniref:hypothetical protein n=1 Tax=Sphingomonas sp. TaxID=28214 RepID=UPI003D6D005C
MSFGIGAAGLLMLAVPGVAAEPVLPRGAFILPGSAVSGMLQQCSRDVPKAGQGSWQPRPADILALEAALPEMLRRQSPRDPLFWKNVPHDWRRQYVGIVRGGHRYIYGNFAKDNSDSNGVNWRREPMQVCDGGRNYFGVEYDVAGRRFTHVAFNGPY